MIRLTGLSRRYGSTRALDGIDLEVRAGERIALVGPSGAGKTTLFRLLGLAVRPTEGRYELDGRDVAALHGADLRTCRMGIATIHQHHDLVGRMSVLRNTLAGRLGRWSWLGATRAFVWPAAADVREVHTVLGRVGIPEKLHARADHLSGGQQQRVAVARAIFQGARLLLADEPVASLDPALAEEIIALLVQSSTEDGRTLMVNLHQVDLARRYFDRVVALADGRVAFDRPIAEVTDEDFARLFARGGRPARDEAHLGDDSDDETTLQATVRALDG